MPTNVAVATNICADQYGCYPVNIDCSLCKMGWPQKSGQIVINFYGKNTQTDTICDLPTWYFGESFSAQGQFCCIPPAQNEEVLANVWQCVIPFSSISSGTAYNKYQALCQIEALNNTDILFNLTVQMLQSDGTWSNCMTHSATLTELSPDPEPWRSRSFKSGNTDPASAIPISWSGDTCFCADEIAFITYSIGTSGWVQGCGSTNNDYPLCGLYDGTQFHSCLRVYAIPTTDPIEFVPFFSQLGFRPNPCGAVGQAYCGCDSFVLSNTTPPEAIPPTGTPPTFNADPQYLIDFALVLGTEGVGDLQEIQLISTAGAPVSILAKSVNNGPTYVCTKLPAEANYTCSLANVVNTKGPHIFEVIRPTFKVWLYSLNFPNTNILAQECVDTAIASYIHTEESAHMINLQPDPVPPAISNEMRERMKADSERRKKFIKETTKRYQIPCIHLGEQLEAKAGCGCTAGPRHACAIYGECRKYSNIKENGMKICRTCDKYEGKE